jgi:8-oxo-dGTP pyrophosphatase MutT (NUDIX family)
VIEMVEYKVNFFGYRVAGVLLNKGKVLLCTNDQVDFWVLPGGGVKPFESSEEAIKREFQEEIGIKIKVVRLLWIVENSYVEDNRKVHGIGLDFLVNPIEWNEKLTREVFYGVEDGYKAVETRYEHLEDFRLTFRWFDIAELDTITIRPKVYHDALGNIPEHPVLLRNLEVEK